MNNPTLKVALHNTPARKAVKGAIVAAAAEQMAEPAAANRVPLTIRTRKIVRLAPPIDDGFRPFRVF
jgi:hypothetical protein